MSGVQAFAHARSAARKLYEEPTPAMLPRAIHSRRGNKSVNNNHGTTCHQTHDHSGRVVTLARRISSSPPVGAVSSVLLSDPSRGTCRLQPPSEIMAAPSHRRPSLTIYNRPAKGLCLAILGSYLTPSRDAHDQSHQRPRSRVGHC